MNASFNLDHRLADDSTLVTALPLCDVRLMNDARFPWLILVPRRADKADLIDLPLADRLLLIEEITAVSTALKAATRCDKLNVAALGNAVRQLHIHVIARFTGDTAWPRPVWGVGEAVAYDDKARDRLAAAILAALPS